MASWYAEVPSDRWEAALSYLLYGRLQKEVLERIVDSESRPAWLADYDSVEEALVALTDDVWRRESLLAALFPGHDEFFEEEESIVPEGVKRNFFARLEEWWSDPEIRNEVVAAYEARTWPEWLREKGLAEGLREGSPDHWLALLVLGACQSLGRTQPSHHRRFIENAKNEGWWEVFKDADSPAAWMEILKSWQDRSTGNLDYARWMSLFPSIYQLSRFLDVYRRLLNSAGRRPEEFYQIRSLLAPRVDHALTGAGQKFDAPPAPLYMGVHLILRELVRLEVIPLNGDHVLPDCWVPAEQVLTLLRPLGLPPLDIGVDNARKARAIFDFMAVELDTPSPNLHCSFDIPLRHIAENTDLGRAMGLEIW